MEIPITDKFWCRSKFDENFNEVSYVDNKGTSFEFIDPVKGTLKFYKNNEIDISQELLDNIKITDQKHEELKFLELMSNLKLAISNKLPNLLLYCSVNGDVVISYSLKTNNFRFPLTIISEFMDCFNYNSSFEETRTFLKNMFSKHLQFYNVGIVVILNVPKKYQHNIYNTSIDEK